MNNLSDETIKAYDKSARNYGKKVGDLHPHDYSRVFCGSLPKKGIILDLGCGSGRDAKIFSEKGYGVVGIDLSTNLLTIAQQTAPKADFIKMDAEHLHFGDECFNGVWACASLLHIPKPNLPNTISGIKRVLKKDGVFYSSFIEGNFEGMRRSREYLGTKKFWAFYQPNKLKAIFEKQGFKEVLFDIQEPVTDYHKSPWLHFIYQK
tara:strand:+ start:28 stop:645 length:618 start_codon:yes stop_codon:yes gene_type:complete